MKFRPSQKVNKTQVIFFSTDLKPHLNLAYPLMESIYFFRKYNTFFAINKSYNIIYHCLKKNIRIS